MKNIIFSLFIVLVTFSSCQWKTTKNALKHGENLKSAIESFDGNRQKLSAGIVNSLEGVSVALAKEDQDLPKISKDFEKEWTGIQNRYDKLKKDFNRVGSSSEDYFNKLDELSNNITNDDLRKQELAKNKQLRVKWESTYNEASVNIDKVTKVLQEGNDFHMVLVASSIRQKLEQNTDELQRISEQAKVLLRDLEAFSKAGRELVEG